MKNYAIYICIVLLTIWIVPAFAAAEKESVYERVMRTQTIRCGYVIWPPFMDKDAATEQFRGMDYDYVMAVGESLDLKIEWVAEVAVGQSVEELRSNKIDAVCTAEGPLYPSTTKFLAYSKPFAYFPFFLYARADDMRFDKNMGAINTPDVKIAVIDGDISSEIVKTYFPNAAQHAMPQMISPSQMYMDVVTGKADVFIDGPISVSLFLKNNPGTLRKIPTQQPLSVIPNTFSVLRGPRGTDFLGMLNQAIENLRNSGVEAKILAPYLEDVPDMLYPVARPYAVVE